MTDAFAEFGLEARPWLEPSAILSQYHELAALRHPDKCGGDPLPLSALNEARRILTSPTLRLRHLLELHGFAADHAGTFEPDFEFFSQVGTLAKKAAALSGGAEESPGAAPLQQEIAALLKSIHLRIRNGEEKIRSLDAAWPDFAPHELARLAEEFSYLKKWEKSLADARTLLLGG